MRSCARSSAGRDRRRRARRLRGTSPLCSRACSSSETRCSSHTSVPQRSRREPRWPCSPRGTCSPSSTACRRSRRSVRPPPHRAEPNAADLPTVHSVWTNRYRHVTPFAVASTASGAGGGSPNQSSATAPRPFRTWPNRLGAHRMTVVGQGRLEDESRTEHERVVARPPDDLDRCLQALVGHAAGQRKRPTSRARSNRNVNRTKLPRTGDLVDVGRRCGERERRRQRARTARPPRASSPGRTRGRPRLPPLRPRRLRGSARSSVRRSRRKARCARDRARDGRRRPPS